MSALALDEVAYPRDELSDARLEYEARTVIADLIARHGEVKAAEMAFTLMRQEIERSRS